MIQVVDASAVVAALIDRGPAGRWCEARIAEGGVAAPHVMPFEAANVIRRHAIAGLIDVSDAWRAFDDLRSLPVDLVPFEAVGDRVWALRASLTAYDASYVAVAEDLGVRLVTLDHRLATAPGVACEIAVAPH